MKNDPKSNPASRVDPASVPSSTMSDAEAIRFYLGHIARHGNPSLDMGHWSDFVNRIMRVLGKIEAAASVPISGPGTDRIEKIARILCRQHGSNPDTLEPGDADGVDGVLPNGDKAHFRWEDFRMSATAIAELLPAPTRKAGDPGAASGWRAIDQERLKRIADNYSTLDTIKQGDIAWLIGRVMALSRPSPALDAPTPEVGREAKSAAMRLFLTTPNELDAETEIQRAIDTATEQLQRERDALQRDVNFLQQVCANDAQAKAEAQAELTQARTRIGELEAALKESVTRDGKWIDKWGSCRVCGGEIPHGHTNECDFFKSQTDRDALRSQLDAARAEIVGLREALTISRSANCLGSYGSTQVDAVEKANALLDRTAADYSHLRTVGADELLHLRSDQECLVQIMAIHPDLNTRREVDDAAAHLVTLPMEEVEQLRKDRERLDWLELPGSWPKVARASEKLVAKTKGAGPFPAHTWRAAFDAALAAADGGKKK